MKSIIMINSTSHCEVLHKQRTLAAGSSPCEMWGTHFTWQQHIQKYSMMHETVLDVNDPIIL